VVVVVLLVVGDQLLVRAAAGHEVLIHELDEAVSVTVGLVLEVEAVVHLGDADCALLRVMSQNQLLQVQERALVVNALSYLHL
jgi:hypothetical protein